MRKVALASTMGPSIRIDVGQALSFEEADSA
jgi:hypothetical protein